MTVAPQRPVLAAPDVDAVVAAVRARGLRLSAARRQVIEALFAAEGPVSADEIASGLGGARSPVDPASVYGNLEVLEDLGLVRHAHLGHGAARWMLADRARTEFLRCEGCGATEAVEPSVLAGARAAIREATGFRARFTHFPVVGLCARCQIEEED